MSGETHEMTSDELLDMLDQHNLVPDVPFQNYPRMAVERARREARAALLAELREKVEGLDRASKWDVVIDGNPGIVPRAAVLLLIDRAALPDRKADPES